MKGIETTKGDLDRESSGFYKRYMSGVGFDVGFKGLGCPDGMEPVLPHAIGIDLDTPGYDGVHLPCETGTVNFVYASHVLEHISDYVSSLREWHRVLAIGGHMVLLLPHGYLYERALYVPGKWGSCADHKRLYTPSRLLREIEESLKPNSYRVVSLRDNDKNFNYDLPLYVPPDYLGASFEIECVLQKIKQPLWDLS